MTPAEAATEVRRIMTEAYERSPHYREVVEREVALIDSELRGLATLKAPEGACERGWKLVRAALRGEQ